MQQTTLEFKENLFPILSSSPAFCDVARGRQGGILVDIKNEDKDQSDMVPIVRGTTCYNVPPSPFSKVHYEIIEQIKQKHPELKLEFNNAMIEIYNHEYYRMGYHTDQSLDLVDDSYICLFSCYNTASHTETKDVRKLQVQHKTTKKQTTFDLRHNSIVLFSTRANREHLHKIVLDLKSGSKMDKKTTWLGLTFRLAKTHVKFIEKVPHLLSSLGDKGDKGDKDVLRRATEEERKELISHKGKENKTIDFIYPPISYTLSVGDLMVMAHLAPTTPP